MNKNDFPQSKYFEVEINGITYAWIIHLWNQQKDEEKE